MSSLENHPEDLSRKEVPIIDSETGKRYFIEYVNSNCCYGKAPANDCEIVQINNFKALYVNFF